MMFSIPKITGNNFKYVVIISVVFFFIIISYILSILKWKTVDEPFFGGFFNTTFWGVQMYFFFAPLALLLYFAAYAFWVHFKWNMMAPFHGLWYASNSQSEVDFVTDIRLNFALLSEAAAKLVFDKERYNSIAADTSSQWTRFRMWLRPVDQAVHIAKYLQGKWDSKPMTNIGMLPASILLDAFGWTKLVSPQRVAIAKAVDIWNDANMNDQVHSLTKAWQYMADGIIPVPDGIELYVTVPWTRIDNAYPKKRYEAQWGGFIRQLAENIARGDYNKGISMTTAGIIVFIVCVIFSAVMFIMKLVVQVPAR